eukprot:jgi/Picre1/30424/NNA_005788.t1
MVDTETAREIDSLRCDVSVQGTLLNYANKVVETEKKKVAVVAHDSKIVLNSLLEDIQETKRRGAREEAWLSFCLSQQKELIGQLMRYMAADRELKKELGMKDDMLHQLQNQMMLTRTQYDERMHLLDSDLRRAQSRANEPHKGEGVEGLEKEVARLKKACQEQEKKRKEAEKTVKEQKKDITAKSKRITSLEESLKAQTQMTPSAPKAVTHAMQAVGNLVDQLGASPMSGASKSCGYREYR